MAEPFLSEIRIFTFPFAPKGWAFCNGQLLPINQNQALFSLLGTSYGGNGQTTFGLPNLQGRTAVHADSGASYPMGQQFGEENHTLTMGETPAHNHLVNASSANANTPSPANTLLAAANNLYGPSNANLTTLLPATISNVGGSQPHNNMQPFLVLNFCIALVGIFPSRN